MTVSPETKAAKLSVSGWTPDGEYTDEVCDAWELKASRRALKNLRTLLYGEPMRQLLRAQIEEADTKIKEIVAASKGEFVECRVDMDVKGFSATAIMQELMASMQSQAAGGDAKDDWVLNVLYPMHPEHYVVPPYTDAGGIVETLGGIPTRIRLVTLQLTELPKFAQEFADESYPYKQCSRAELDDGTVAGYILHEFRDTSTGSHLIFRGLFPAATPKVYFDEHYEHFAVEFRNFVRTMADRAQRKGVA